jgi:CarD family transcriptional regulator
MFKKGDLVVHPYHGGGIVEDLQTQRVGGVEHRYYCIELASGDGTLMIPVDQAEEAGLRPALLDMDMIIAVLSDDPQELSADYRERHGRLAAKIHSGDPALVAQVLRDLAWREHASYLTSKDERFKGEAQEMLAGELALRPGLDVEAVTRRLVMTLRRAIEAQKTSEAEVTPG